MNFGKDDVADRWRTSIVDMAPGKIHLRGHPVQNLIGQLTFAKMLWLMTRNFTQARSGMRTFQ